jgi:transketolase
MAYGNLGYSHHAVQDLAIMRTLPGIRVFSPGDPGEARECIEWQVKHPAPAYLRLGKAGEPVLHDVKGILNGPLHVRKGTGSVALVTTGGILKVAAEVYEVLRMEGIELEVFSVPVLKPVASGYFAPLAKFRTVVALEEHVAEGGLASVLRENLRGGTDVVSMHVDETTANCVGTQEYLRVKAGIDASRVAVVVRGIVRANPVF